MENLSLAKAAPHVLSRTRQLPRRSEPWRARTGVLRASTVDEVGRVWQSLRIDREAFQVVVLTKNA